ncbi:hypothetical protein [Dyadobacter sediminis]|uniref:hypothetical protein n=1 Tax=Dyadobacter sediminis TaxID=1493691 RepID=UPI0014874D4A|nr:hypothetical protein [Dyadobacter sediminis]GGB93704.1 hypothetical protein GCM10011325_21430 [Dyadobacter sediminis]
MKEVIEIPEWQKESVLARLREAEENPEMLIPWMEAKQKLEAVIKSKKGIHAVKYY